MATETSVLTGLDSLALWGALRDADADRTALADSRRPHLRGPGHPNYDQALR
jgi:hypothetical protein